MGRRGSRASRDRRRRVSLTREGAGVLGLAFFLGVAAVNSGQNLIYLLSAVLFGLFLTGLFLPALSLLRLEANRRHPGHIFAGEEMAVAIGLRNRKRTFRTYSIRLREVYDGPEAGGWIPEVRPREESRTAYEIALPRRGRHRFEALLVSTRFPFGLVEWRRRIPHSTEVIVFPQIRSFLPSRRRVPSAGRVVQRRSWIAGDEEEFHGVREYRDGDNPRRIHWKSSARTGSLMVKDLHDRKRDRVVVLLDTSVAGSRGSVQMEDLERGIILAASILHDAYRRNRAFSLIAFTPGMVDFPGDRGRTHLYRILESLACLEPSGPDRSALLLREAKARTSDQDEVWFLSLGRRRAPAPWETVDLSRGEDRDLLEGEG